MNLVGRNPMDFMQVGDVLSDVAAAKNPLSVGCSRCF